MDLDAWQERSAIMEFDGGLSRFRAETLAAQTQGRRRDEMLAALAREARRGPEAGGGDRRPSGAASGQISRSTGAA
jgi:5'-3' exonuclease